MNSKLYFLPWQPMLEYIERKQFTGEDCASMAARKASVATRNVVELPNACDFSRRTADDVPSASIRLEDFVNKYTAKQMKQRNTTTSRSYFCTGGNYRPFEPSLSE